MIFVTVGTTRFEPLIREIDDLAGSVLTEPVVCQIGSGDYEPRHCEFFRYRPTLDDLIERTDLLITHGGSTVITAVEMRTPLIAVANTSLADNHQEHFLREFSAYSSLVWTNEPTEIGALIKTYDREPVNFNAPSLVPDMLDYLKSG
ncbi:MAG: hypothetical protein Pars93KO_28130 [Parasphingorhabdus sp.]